jgi:type IV secretion system protein VirB10
VTPDGADTVPGERGLPLVRQAASLHAKLSNLLAMGLMLAMGAAVLTGYYLHTAHRQAQERQQAKAATSSRAQSEMVLPALDAGTTSDSIDPVALPASVPLEVQAMPSVLAPAGAPAGSVAPRPSSLERRLSGNAFARSGSTPDGGSGTGSISPELTAASASVGAPAALTPAASGNAATEVLPHSEFGSMGLARMLPLQRLLLPKGAFIDCTLETAIDSTLPGMTTCITATDTFGVDGRVVLLERGTKLVGETRGQVQQGMARVFVLWTEARTPAGVIVPLDSPGTDELGRSGLPGSVDRHFWERFGAALLITTIDGAVQAAVQSSSRGSGTIIYNPSATQDVGTEVLKSTLSIAPTVRKSNGDRIQILVARDIDFTGVYELRRAASQH